MQTRNNQKAFAVMIALLLAVPTVSLTAYAQNATSTTNTTTTETNTTLPVEATQLPVFPDVEAPEAVGNQTEPESQPSVNQSESKDNATKVLGLLDDAQVKIDEARNIIRALQAQVEADRDREDQPGLITNETEEIIESANDSAIDIGAVINNTLPAIDPGVVDDVGNITEDIEDAIEDSIESNENATAEDIENVTDDAVEAIENATESTDNSTVEVALDNAMIRLLSNLVSAQDFNQNLGQEDKDELKANLQDAIAELASDAADSLR